ncbi:MAG: PIN domain-containing protein [Janthinobacterium lividum]
MAQYLLDTNIASFIMKQTSPELLRQVAQQPRSSLAICSVSEAELRYGMQRMPREARVWTLVPTFLSEIVIQPWDSLSAERYATVAIVQQRAGKPLSIFDTMIAAHALAHSLTLVTNDQAFQQVEGLSLEDWTKGPQRA